MTTLTSEAEFERLYQEFVRRNGGLPTLVADQYNTPASYYKATSENTLSPEKLAELQAKQAQYNRQAALNTISNEIENNNFTNPYNSRSQAAISNLNSISSIPLDIQTYSAVIDPTAPGGYRMVPNAILQSTVYNQLGGVRDAFSPLLDTSIGGSAVLAAAVYAGLAELTGIDIEKLILGAGLITAGIAMFGDLQTHTNDQATDIPGKINEIDQLTGLQKSFGEMPADSCSLFNELMGIMSGSFDGVLDFIESGIDSFKDFMANSALGSLLNQIGSVVSSIISEVGMVASSIIALAGAAINNILEQTGLGDLLKSLGNLAAGIVGGIADMAAQIANEIAGLVNMAANIANKLAALSLAGAMMDPCKMAVLLNTGTPALAGAAQQLNSPLESTIPNVNIPTEVDSRANPQEVLSIVQSATSQAATQPGVPQSPTNALASLYSPFSSYLHGLFGVVGGVFNDTLETVGDTGVLNRISDTSPNNPNLSGLSTITSSLDGSVGDISRNIGALSLGRSLGTSIASNNITGSNTDNDDFSTGGAGLNIPEDQYDDAILREARKIEPTRSSPENSQATRVVTENTAEGTISRLEGPSTQTARAAKLWRKQYKSRYTRAIRDAGNISKETRNYTLNAKFKTSELKRETELLYEDALRLKNEITSFANSESKKFVYRSKTQDRDELKERSILNEYNTVMQSTNDLTLAKFSQELSEITQTWNSIKVQAILS